MGLFKKGSKAFSIFGFKCPRCHEGDLFDHPILEFKKSFDMPLKCKICKQNYMPEPGFYFGAMFISYAIMGFFSLGFVAICMFVFDLSVNASFLWLIFVCILMFVWIFRLSRSIWISVNVKYDPNILQNEKFQ